jgi:arylsulfatase A-like enzyme
LPSTEWIRHSRRNGWTRAGGGFDQATTAGVLISNRPVGRQVVSIMDIASTVLKYFGVEIPGEIDGQPLF